MKKADVILSVSLVTVALCVLLVFSFLPQGETVQVTIDGEVVKTLPLSQNQTLTLHTPYGDNVLTVQNGTAYIQAADCRGNDCVHQGSISQSGQLIVCLPHKLVVTILGDTPLYDFTVRASIGSRLTAGEVPR